MQLDANVFDYKKMNYYENYRKNTNFSYMQSLILIGNTFLSSP